MTTVLIPTYGRPAAIAPVLNSIKSNSYFETTVLFIAERDDTPTLTELSRLGANISINVRSRNYAGAINSVLESHTAIDTHYFIGADDLKFHSYWDLRALQVMRSLPTIKVVGTNDLLNQFVLEGTHATHYLVAKDYIDTVGGVIDGKPGHLLYEGYDHNYTDTEFIGTAKARAVFAPCLDSVVEHLHFTAGKSPKDLTYEKGYANIDADAQKYLGRRHLWWEVSR